MKKKQATEGESSFTQEEFDIDFATCVNMFGGMSYEEAHRVAVSEYKEYQKGGNLVTG